MQGPPGDSLSQIKEHVVDEKPNPLANGCRKSWYFRARMTSSPNLCVEVICILMGLTLGDEMNLQVHQLHIELI